MNARAYGLYGFILGFLLPFLGTMMQAMFSDAGGATFGARLGHAQSLPVMWLVDLAPIVFGVLGFIIGSREDQLRALEDAKRTQLSGTATDLYTGAQGLLSTVSSFSSTTSQTAASVRETTTTMQQLSQTAARAALSAETVVGLANATKKSSEDGLQEIKLSVSELLKLSEDVRALAKSVEGINERMRSIFEIASVMNYLGERFQGLADSAATEIGQSGSAEGLPMGLRFIVAEMRRQGKDAKNGATLVQNIINEMQKVMTATMSAAENGVRRAERGAQIANRTGDNIKRMSAALMNSSQAAMEIATIAKQQDQGIDEVLKSLNQVYLATEEAMTSTQRVAAEAKVLHDLASRLDSVVRVNGAQPAPALKVPQALLKLTGGKD
ncbi:MAG TPA: methyl-accepting chemotaxis protein [Anaeromyxobacteraceae bacterium]|nr:methyl-accepting chemotaxis protein [Anaeromyxobacteraceae bacterium]